MVSYNTIAGNLMYQFHTGLSLYWPESLQSFEITTLVLSVVCRGSVKSESNKNCVIPENIHTPPMEEFFGLNAPPLWKFQFRFILSFKNFGL